MSDGVWLDYACDVWFCYLHLSESAWILCMQAAAVANCENHPSSMGILRIRSPPPTESYILHDYDFPA